MREAAGEATSLHRGLGTYPRALARALPYQGRTRVHRSLGTLLARGGLARVRALALALRRGLPLPRILLRLPLGW